MSRQIGSVKGAKKKADTLFSLIIRSRGSCERCGQSDYSKLQTAHIISRRFSHTRCIEANAHCLCAGCHHFFTDHPVEMRDFVVATIGLAEYQRLNTLSQQTGKVDWFAVAASLKARWEGLAA